MYALDGVKVPEGTSDGRSFSLDVSVRSPRRLFSPPVLVWSVSAATMMVSGELRRSVL